MPETLKIDRFDAHPVWGACVFLEALTDDGEAIRSAYAEGAPEWPPLHFAVARADAAALDPWYRLGFAQMHAYAVRPAGGETVEVAGVQLRRGGPARAVGHVTLYPDPGDERALHLASTAVVTEERGSGVGRLLTAFALSHAAERGFDRVRTNWRVTNLVASRYWPARGFELTQIRLARRIPDV
jgi:ribosomal protein S18 acetylase RimI-like enzyme